MPKWREKLKNFFNSRTSLPVGILLVVVFVSVALAISSYQGKQKAHAAPTNCYWLGTTSTSWNNAANWSDTSGGTASMCNGGANVPGAETTVIFDVGSANNPALLDATTTVAGVTTTAAYSGTITLADNVLTLTATAVSLTAGTITIADQGGTRTKMTMTSLTLAGGTFTVGSFSRAVINGNFTETSGTLTIRSSAAFNLTSGDFDVSGGTFTNSAAGTSSTGLNLLGNSSNITHAPAQLGYVALNKTAGQTLTLLVPITVSSFVYTAGILNTNGQLITLNVDSGVLNLAGQTIDSFTSAANPAYISGSMTVNGTLTVNTGKKLLVQNNAVVTLSDAGRLVLTGTAEYRSYNLNVGTLAFTDDAATNIPTTGSLGGKVKIIAATKDITLPARAYAGRLEVNSTSGALKTVTMGAGTFTIGNSSFDTEFGTGLFVSADGAGNLILDGSVNSPTVTISSTLTTQTVSHIDFTGVGAGSETIKAGTANTWSLKGNMTLTDGSLIPGTSTFNFNGTGSQTQALTSAGSSFYNLTVSNTNATGFTFADGATVTGTFRDTTATSKVTFHSTATYTIANINIAGTGAGANLVTLKSSTGASAALFNVSQINPTTSYVTVSDSNASGGQAINATDGTNVNGGGNTFWNFASTVPAAPTIGVATAGNTQASVTFTPPADNGGSPITGYTATSTPEGHTGSGAGSPIVVASLTNGTSYTFTVHATNANGDSVESAASNAVIPSTVPDAPTIGVATPGNAQVSVAFTPNGDGGSAITGYTVTSTPGSFTGAGVGSPIVVGGLTNGTSYTFTVHATNVNGDSVESAASNPAIPSTVPGAPTVGVATAGAGVGQATVTFSAPGSDGGSVITGYTVTSTPSSFTGTGAGSPITVSGLANGTAYTFTVHATNVNGDGPESAASNSITTFAVPGAPTIGVATAGAGVGQATVTFSAPGSDGGTPITGYTVTSTPGSFTGTGAGSPITVSGLANGTAYTFKVYATNIVGNGPESAASNSITTFAVPGAPTIGVATGGNAQASITFVAPGSDGGSVITGYTVTSTPEGHTGTGAGSPIIVGSLTNGTSYTFTVHATNAVGNGPESAASNAVVPSTVPDAPTGILAVAGNAQAQVAFTAPADGGSPITGYTVTSTPGSITASGLLSPITVNGLTNGTTYTFTVHATNANGNGPESAPSNAVTPSAPVPPSGGCNNNGIQDNGETGIDCGGGNCLACQELRLHMTSPKLNDTYYLGGSLPIRWKIGFGDDTSTYSNSPSVITQLEISTDGGITFRFIKNLLPADMSPNDPVYLAHHAGQPYGHYSAVGIVGLQGSYFAYDWQLPIDQTLAGDRVEIRLTPKVYDSGTPITAESSRNFKITGLGSISIGITPDESVIAPGGNISYSAKVYDQDNHDITSSCPVTWSMRVPPAGSINGSGLLTATSALGIWIDSVKGQANCGGLSDFRLATFVTTNEARKLSYVWTSPWSASVKEPVKNTAFNVWGYDQFGLRLTTANYSFSLLDSRIGSITTNGRVANIATSNNYGCYPNKIKGTASYNGVEMSAFGSVTIYPANYAYNGGGSNCGDGAQLKDKILASLTGASRAYAAEGQIFTSVSYGAPKYFRPGQVGAFTGVPRDQLATPMDGVSVQYILKDANAGQLAKDGKFIATTNIGSYPNAIEIRASLGGTVISNTFSVTVTTEKRRATTVMAWGPTGATELTSKRVLKMWKGSNYSFYSTLRDQFGDTISGQLFARSEDVSGRSLVNILGPTTLSANNTEGTFKNAIKVTYDIDRINQTIVYDNEKIDGSSPALYLTLDINAKNDDPAVCLYGPHKICDPLDPGCVTVCTGNSCNGGGGGIGGLIADIIAFLVNLFGDALMKAISIAVLAIVAAISLLLALLSLLANLLPFLQSTHIFSMFAKSKDRKNAKGLIYEAASGLPIPGVKVMLFRARDQKLQAVATSDKDGKFALAVPPGEEYYLQTKSFGYDQVKEDRSQVLQKYGLKYSNNYFGERFSSRDTVHYFDRQVPMAANANASLQAAKIHRVEVISKILRILNVPLLIIGFSFSLIVFYSNKSVFNSVVVGLYIVIFVYYIVAFFVVKGRSYGLVYKKTDNSPIDQAIVRAISETTGKLVRTTVSDDKGRYALALPRGYYNIVVTKANLQQEEISRSRVKSNFSPTKEKIQLSETQIASVVDRPMPPATPISKTGTPARASLDAAEIIEKYNPKINSKEI